MKDFTKNNDRKHSRGCYTANPKDSELDSYTSEKDNLVIGHYSHNSRVFFSNWIVLKSTPIDSISALEKQFNELSSKWKSETGLFSTMFHKINDSYLDIIGMGKDVVPFILRDMQQSSGSAHWHTALKAITKENPVPIEDINKSRKIKEDWISWGKKRNLI